MPWGEILRPKLAAEARRRVEAAAMPHLSSRAVGDDFRELIARSPVIPAVRQPQHLPQAIAAPSAVVYLLCGSVMTVREMVETLRAGGKAAVVNIDLLGGLSGDVPGVQFLEACGVSGVISTHTETLRAARARSLLAIQRSFLLDSHAVGNSLRALERFLPDAVEMLPAPAAPRVVAAFSKAHPELVLTAGGLIHSLAEIDALVREGISATSVSDTSLWVA